jgi:hypothetical protein
MTRAGGNVDQHSGGQPIARPAHPPGPAGWVQAVGAAARATKFQQSLPDCGRTNFRFSDEVPAYTNVFQLFKPGQKPSIGRVGAAGP